MQRHHLAQFVGDGLTEDEINDQLTIQGEDTVLALYLKDCRITRIPDAVTDCSRAVHMSVDMARTLGKVNRQIGDMTELRALHLTASGVTSLPRSITNLTELVTLDLSDNGSLKKVPKYVENLPRLTHLNLGHTRVKKFSPTFHRMNLTSLELWGCPIEELPLGIATMQLQHVVLSFCHLTELPEGLFLCPLRHLSCTSSPTMCRLPQTLGRAKDTLEVLELAGTTITNLPENIGECRNLTSLDISNTRVDTLPAGFEGLENLVNLQMNSCPFTEVPGSLVDLPLEIIGMDATRIHEIPRWVLRSGTIRLFSANCSLVETIDRGIAVSDVELRYENTPLRMDENVAMWTTANIPVLSDDGDDEVNRFFDLQGEGDQEPPRQRRRTGDVTREELSSSPTMAALLYAPGADTTLQLRSRAIRKG